MRKVWPTDAQSLIKEWKSRTDELDDNTNARLRRSTSWVTRAQEVYVQNDYDGTFINHWIAFNSLYATRPLPIAQRDEYQRPYSEKEAIDSFFKQLVPLDTGNDIHHVLRYQQLSSVKSLLKNKYVFQPFWENRLGIDPDRDWKTRLKKSKKKADTCIYDEHSRESTITALSILFERLYTVRNQLMHGLATYEGSVNRRQVIDGAAILHSLLPVFIRIFINNPDTNWGELAYPKISPIG